MKPLTTPILAFVCAMAFAFSAPLPILGSIQVIDDEVDGEGKTVL